MKLHEYQAKKIFSYYNINTPHGIVCSNLEEMYKAIKKIGGNKWALKCQVHSGSRGKAGGIIIVNNKKDLKKFANKWFGNNIVTEQTDSFGKPVRKILVENANINILNEFYLSFLIDNESRKIIVMASNKGGVEVEKFSIDNPNLIHKIKVDPIFGPQLYQARILSYKLNLNDIQIKKFTELFMKLTSILLKFNFSLIEINPIIINEKNDFICLDGKIVMDKNAAFKHKKIIAMYDNSQNNEIEKKSFQLGLNYISLEGNIGCLVNGAGLAMCTMDMISLYGGKPANFLDIGGGIKQENIIQALKIILSHTSVKALVINIFGGIVRCDYIADGIINAIKLTKIKLPIIVRLEGNNADLGLKKLLNSNINVITAHNLKDAIKLVINAVKR